MKSLSSSIGRLLATVLLVQSLCAQEFFEDIEKSSFRTKQTVDANEEILISKILRYREFLDSLLQRKDEKFYDLDGNCLDFSGRLSEEMRTAGFPVQLAQTAPSSQAIYLKATNGFSFLADKIHFFLIDRELGEDREIIIDPTIMQFFDKRTGALEIQKIFVGTREDLIAFYRKNRQVARFRISADGDEAIDPGQGHYSPDDLVCVIYSVNECAHTRTNL